MLLAFDDAKEILEYAVLRELADEDVREKRQIKRIIANANKRDLTYG